MYLSLFGVRGVSASICLNHTLSFVDIFSLYPYNLTNMVGTSGFDLTCIKYISFRLYLALTAARSEEGKELFFSDYLPCIELRCGSLKEY